jgi:hypothetical protein
MTPKNRDQLARLLWQVSASSIGSVAEQGEQIMRDLDAAGLAIVPKVPTEAMLRSGEKGLSAGDTYDAMLEASPFKEDTDHE